MKYGQLVETGLRLAKSTNKVVINYFFFFFLFWKVCLSMGIWFPPTTVLLTIFVFLFDCIC